MIWTKSFDFQWEHKSHFRHVSLRNATVRRSKQKPSDDQSCCWTDICLHQLALQRQNRGTETAWQTDRQNIEAVLGGWCWKQMSILQFQLQSKERGLKPHSKWCSSIIVLPLVFYMVIYYLFISSFCGMSASFSQLAHLTWMYDFIVSLSNRSTIFTSSVRVWGDRLY